MIRGLVVDDSLFMRTIIRDMLENDPDIEVIDVAQDGIEALKKIDELAPDVMTIDIEMPRMDGLEVLRHISQYRNFPKTLLLSSLTSAGAEMTRNAMELGADDFMLKTIGTVPSAEILSRSLKSSFILSEIKNQINWQRKEASKGDQKNPDSTPESDSLNL